MISASINVHGSSFLSLNIEHLKLEQVLGVCVEHADALTEALDDFLGKHFSAVNLSDLSGYDRRMLDQFAYRSTRLQDDMGGRLVLTLVHFFGEEIAAMSMIDHLNRLEQLGWIQKVDEWQELCRISNEFAHDSRRILKLRLARLQLAMGAARRLIEILAGMSRRAQGHLEAGRTI